MTPEQLARIKIDKLLEACGWVIQDRAQLNLAANLGVAVREWPLECGQVDYLLFVDRKPVGVLEAKKEGTTLSGVAEQATMYLRSKPKGMPNLTVPMRFHYESTGTETYFRDIKDPESRSRRVLLFTGRKLCLIGLGIRRRCAADYKNYHRLIRMDCASARLKQ